MGKIKETYSSLYYQSKEDFLNEIEAGSQPNYVGLIEIVRLLKLLSQEKKKWVTEKSEAHESSDTYSDQQLCFAAQA